MPNLNIINWGLRRKEATSLSKVLDKEINFKKVGNIFTKHIMRMWEEFLSIENG